MIVVRCAVHLRLPEGRETRSWPLRPWRFGINVVVPCDEPVIEVDARQSGSFAGQAKTGCLHRSSLPAAGFHGLSIGGAVEARRPHVERLPCTRQQCVAAEPRLPERID
jgi:hypothetical protein